jgi:ribosomal protein S27AE
MNNNLGKYIRNTGLICPDCEKGVLELRQHGERRELVCPRCNYREFTETKRVRRREEIEEEALLPIHRNPRPIARRS